MWTKQRFGRPAVLAPSPFLILEDATTGIPLQSPSSWKAIRENFPNTSLILISTNLNYRTRFSSWKGELLAVGANDDLMKSSQVYCEITHPNMKETEIKRQTKPDAQTFSRRLQAILSPFPSLFPGTIVRWLCITYLPILIAH